MSSHAPAPPEEAPPAPVVAPNPAFLQTFHMLGPVPPQAVVRLPNETWDFVVPPAGAPAPFVTSNQCQSCHSAALAPFGPTMYLPGKSDNGVNVSPYTEWRWSPMGLAGRDPIFFAQLESELAYVDEVRNPATRRDQKHAIVNTVLPLPRRDGQASARSSIIPATHVRARERDAHRQRDRREVRRAGARRRELRVLPSHPPGRLRRAGERAPLEYFLSTRHRPLSDRPGGRLFGPFKDEEIVTVPMENASARSRSNPYIKSARLCGSCHTINLPVIDADPDRPIGPSLPHSIEQATYLEWLNSAYQNELGTPASDGADLPGLPHAARLYERREELDVPQIQTRIAIIEDDTYPAAEHRAPAERYPRALPQEGFARHELLGMNAFLLEMFRQFNDVLGVRKTDYMTGTSDNLEDAQANVLEQARARTATVAGVGERGKAARSPPR